MQFPAYIKVGSLALHPHWVFEALAFVVAFRIYLALRRRHGDPLLEDARWWVAAAGLAGAVFGGKLLYLLEDSAATVAHRFDAQYLLGGKTIVGAIIGGWCAVEFAKRRLGVRQRTGDLFAIPLSAGIAIGRIGCFLSGLSDHTSGIRTALPWGVDFGDGRRHPTQVYEILFLIILGALIVQFSRRPHREGALFRIFVVGYFAFRLFVEFLKPVERVFAGLSSIQWACALTLGYCAFEKWHSSRPILTLTPAPAASTASREP
jgi:phosphatidylglycerol---prolipoprotein diacylglyceryl transferase